MAVSSSVDPERPDAVRRSIRSSFAVRVAVPAVGLAVLWVLGMAAAFRTAMTGRTLAHSHTILAEYGLLAVAGLVAIAATAALTGSFGRRLSRDLASLADAAEQLAGPAAGRRRGPGRGGEHRRGRPGRRGHRQPAPARRRGDRQ